MSRWKYDVTSSNLKQSIAGWFALFQVCSPSPDRAIHCLMTQLPGSPSLVWHQGSRLSDVSVLGSCREKNLTSRYPQPNNPENGMKYLAWCLVSSLQSVKAEHGHVASVKCKHNNVLVPCLRLMRILSSCSKCRNKATGDDLVWSHLDIISPGSQKHWLWTVEWRASGQWHKWHIMSSKFVCFVKCWILSSQIFFVICVSLSPSNNAT